MITGSSILVVEDLVIGGETGFQLRLFDDDIEN
jgi:hypothetical protein